MNDNNGRNEMCCCCGCPGHTAHDLSWSERLEWWVCDDCSKITTIRRRKQRRPTQQEFDRAEKKLLAAGFEYHFSLMADDANKEGVTNFGKFYVRNNQTAEADSFWLNYKTIALALSIL